MVGLAVCAVKVYQTSYFTVPEQPAVVPLVKFALLMVPVILLQVVLDVSVIALLQRSFAGGSVMQIEKSQAVPPVGVRLFE